MIRRKPGLLVPALILVLPILGASAPGRAVEHPHEACSTCHRIGDVNAPAETSESVCLDCHEDVLRPAGKFRGTAASQHAWPERKLSEELLEGPTMDRLDCFSCHTPHPNGLPYQLREIDPRTVPEREGISYDPTSRFCLSCHPIAGETGPRGGPYVRHPVGIVPGFGGSQGSEEVRLPLADVRGTPDPRDDVIACTTCHSVHTSPYAFLLRWPRDHEGAACGSCHAGVFGPSLGDLSSR